MSAFDVAGSVVWSVLAVFLLGAVVLGDVKTDDDKTARATVLLIGIITAFGAVFCIARLCGAHW